MKLDKLQAPRAAALLLALSLLGGCATTTGQRNPRDPWEGYNRHAHRFGKATRVECRPVRRL